MTRDVVADPTRTLPPVDTLGLSEIASGTPPGSAQDDPQDEDRPLADLEDSQSGEEEPETQPRSRSRRPPVRVHELEIAELELTDDDDSQGTQDEELSEEEHAEPDDAAVRGRGRQGARRGRCGRGRERGRGQRIGVQSTRKLSGGNAETAETITRRGVVWTKGRGRAVCPHVASGGSRIRPRLTLYNYTEKPILSFFMHMFPSSLVVEISRETTLTGRNIGLGLNFEVTEGDMWLFLGCKHYMSVFPQEGNKEDYWAPPGEERNGEVFFIHHLEQYGLTYSRYRNIERAFTLPTHGEMSDPFNPIRLFVDKWNQNMFRAFVPGSTITIDESMTEWLGRAMPSLMIVPRKPTDTGREGHTAACTESGILIFYETYEGAARMESKEFVAEFGKNPAKAMRCAKNWFRSGRLVLVDAGFASVELAMGLAEYGLFMIGNVKTAHAGFPKDWLLSQVKERGDRATCTAEVRLPDGSSLSLLAAADKDKQPMALLGSAGCSSEGQAKIRHFTTIRADGTYFVREAVLNQMHIHELYRSGFNTLDKHNAYRQGGNSV